MNKKEHKLPPAAIDFAKYLIIIGILLFCFTYVFCPFYIEGNNMFPSVKNGDLCILYRTGSYYTGDAVAYRDSNGQQRMGRIVGMPGETIDFPDSGGYTVNGWQPAETVTYQTFRAESSDMEYPVAIPEGAFFILNDFRSDTADSREYGCIKEAEIIGKVVFLVRRRGI